jgi:hypothetical protein
MLDTPTEQMREGKKMEWTKKGRLGIDAIKQKGEETLQKLQ